MSSPSVATDRLRPGSPFPLGVSTVPGGHQFAVHAPDAQGVELCLIDHDGAERRLDLPQQTYGIWHGIVDGISIGQRYGFRAHGNWDPQRGLRFNSNKLLIDPWARQIVGGVGDANALLAHADDPFGTASTVDSLGHVPLSVVTEPTTAAAAKLETPWAETVIYTARHSAVAPEHRGTYLGLAADPVIEHLVSLGITAVELLPVQAFLTEPPVAARGMRNHWGYSTAAYFAPHPGYASRPGEEIAEFRTMVDRLHAAGIEVLLDVVYNHTCEWAVDGPSISWRGLDARGYYALDGDGRDIDLTGCGNTVDAHSPAAVRLVCDSLRYWYTEMGVDGFRFDLASVLGRTGDGPFDARAPLLSAITTDLMLQRSKLIAEPWDATAAGYQVGKFGLQWSEWNDKFRDDVRRFWAGGREVRELASRLAGSEDIYGDIRRPWASVNFITAHDGFTVADLVSYAEKHNDANGEDGKDGTNNNYSVNHGVEGPTDDPSIEEARGRHVRALLATLLLSTGTPMLLAGDELGHTQGGNNNAYCVPTDTPAADAWAIDWPNADWHRIAYVTRLLQLRKSSPALRQPEFFDGRATPTGHPDLVWFAADGTEMTIDDWNDNSRCSLQAWIDESDVRSSGETPDQDDNWLLILHSGDAVGITTACPEWFDGTLEVAFDSTTPDGAPANSAALPPRSVIELSGPTFLALRALSSNPGR
ncbi:glycogen debranching protein GlgX [Antrihabitans cavernicola]|uniref:glycogen debranching protein GlgX n=1 Tax=Antrihabitans cavernicola TaxID=2495913 RepID=UPI001F3CA217|nr:glycogen debranching protein GlgX [Spelaeibacter cavernicola]